MLYQLVMRLLQFGLIIQDLVIRMLLYMTKVP
jgi:hypothetical protein